MIKIKTSYLKTLMSKRNALYKERHKIVDHIFYFWFRYRQKDLDKIDEKLDLVISEINKIIKYPTNK